jgi:hypothetical protein
MAMVDGGIRRRQPGNSPPVVAAALAAAAGAWPPLALPRFPGAIVLQSRFVFAFLNKNIDPSFKIPFDILPVVDLNWGVGHKFSFLECT